MKKIISRLLAVIMVFGMMSVSTQAATDLEGHWAQNVVEDWVSRGYISGYTDGSFKPNDNITRAEFASVVNKAFGYTATQNIYFYDVYDSDWYYSDIQKAITAGYMSGYNDGTIRPNNSVSREEASVMIYKILSLTPYESGALAYTDLSAGYWANPYIGAVTNAGIMRGYGDNTFRPYNLMTRAEMVSALATAKNRVTQLTAVYLPPYETQAGVYYPYTSTTASSGASSSDSSTTVSGDTHTISSSTYGSNSENTRLRGRVEVTARSSTIRNVDISGDLFITREASGTINLYDVNVSGTMYVLSSGTINIEDSDITRLDVDPYSSAPRINARRNTTISSTYVYSDCTLNESSIRSSYGGFQDVYIESSTSRDSRINLSGDFDSVEILADRVRLNLTSGEIDHLFVDEDAENSTINLSSGTTVNTIDIDGRYTRVTGSGTVKKAIVNARNVTFSRRPNTISGSYTPEYNTSGNYTATINIYNSSGRALSDASVEVYYNGTYERTRWSNSSGVATIDNLLSGTYTLLISHSDYGTNSVSITIYDSDIERDVTLREGYTYTLYVMDQNSQPVNGASVTISSLSRTQSTNSSGAAVFTNLTMNTAYSYSLSLPTNYTATSLTGSFTMTTASRSTTHSVTKTDTAAATYPVTVTVTDSVTTLPINNATVEINGTQGTTNTSGQVVIQVETGTHRLNASATGYTNGWKNTTVGTVAKNESIALVPATPPTPTYKADISFTYGTTNTPVTAAVLGTNAVEYSVYRQNGAAWDIVAGHNNADVTAVPQEIAGLEAGNYRVEATYYDDTLKSNILFTGQDTFNIASGDATKTIAIDTPFVTTYAVAFEFEYDTGMSVYAPAPPSDGSYVEYTITDTGTMTTVVGPTTVSASGTITENLPDGNYEISAVMKDSTDTQTHATASPHPFSVSGANVTIAPAIQLD